MISALSFDESVSYLDSLYLQPILPASRVELRRITYLLARLDNPHQSFRSVHIAGSNGRGSTTAMVDSILRAAGFRTGRFSSPHLESITERIAVNGAWITRAEWERQWRVLGPLVEEMTESSLKGYELGRP